MSYELSPVPASLFEENGMMYVPLKTILKTKLQVEQSNRIHGPSDAVIIDGCVMLWTVHWPTNGVVQDYVVNFMGTTKYRLTHCDVYVVFDKYIKTNTKQLT